MSAAIKVLLFGAAADRAGTRQVEVPVDEDTTLEEVWSVLVDRYPTLQPMRDTLAFAINEEYARTQDKVLAGDEVAVLPPVSGG